MSAVDTDRAMGHYCHVHHATMRCTRQCYAVARKTGDVWVACVCVGVAYDRHDALNSKAVDARHYKYMATMPLLHYTHLLLAVTIHLHHRLKIAHTNGDSSNGPL